MGMLLHGEAVGDAWHSPEWGRGATSSTKRAAPGDRGDGVRYRQAKAKCSSVVRDAGEGRSERDPGITGGRSAPGSGAGRKSDWYCPTDFGPSQPHLLRPVPREG
ncbi:hypothetical protein BN2537_6231 [Streptomyces venezuelae]|nr:hypothetical protein BN2537_6231 [Streptomyces venezuelae]